MTILNVVAERPFTDSEKVTVNGPLRPASAVGVLVATVGLVMSTRNERDVDVASVLPDASSVFTRQK